MPLVGERPNTRLILPRSPTARTDARAVANGQSRNSIRSARQREQTRRLRRFGSAARSDTTPGWAETSIELLTPVTVTVDRLRQLDYLSQAFGDH